MFNVLLFLNCATEELFLNNHKKSWSKTNFYGVEILHSMNLHYKIREKNPKRVSQNFVRISGD